MGTENKPGDGSCCWLPMGDCGRCVEQDRDYVHPANPAVPGQQRRKQPFGSF